MKTELELVIEKNRLEYADFYDKLKFASHEYILVKLLII